MWIKKHWNDPITVGGFTKLNIWIFIISCIAVLIEIMCFTFNWHNLVDKIKAVKSAIVHNISALKR